MLYIALDYYLLNYESRKAYLNSVGQVDGFSGFVQDLEDLFNQDPLMYSKALYLDILNDKLDQIGRIPGPVKPVKTERIFINDVKIKSGVTISSIDMSNIKLQNSFPRRTMIFIYKKAYYDRNGDYHEISGYLDQPLSSFRFEPGMEANLEAFEVGSQLSTVSASMSSIDLASSTGPINLPVNESSEFLAEYEVVVLGAGDDNSLDRNLSPTEISAREDLNVETYALDYLLPTLLDIGGNKNLLPPFGSSKENALYNAVLPVLEANPTVLEAIKNHEFKTASEILLPELYGDIRLSNELRELLKDVYDILSDGGNLPETFVQSNELIETGHPRFELIMEAMYKNMNFDEKTNVGMLRTEAKDVEHWIVNSIDAEVNLIPQEVDVCLGQATEIRTSLQTFFEPEVESIEYHWSTSNQFGGRVQDIENDPNNFGTSIVTSSNIISYISVALASELGNGDNLETVSVVVYAKDLSTGALSEIGRDEMQVNNLRNCTSFYVPFTKEVLINELTTLACGNNTEYFLGHPTFLATFEAVENAVSYKGKIKRMDGTFGNEFTMTTITDVGNGVLEYRLGVGPIVIYSTCNQAAAQAEQQDRLDYLETVGHQGVEVTPVF
jgi:hypothetical protein